MNENTVDMLINISGFLQLLHVQIHLFIFFLIPVEKYFQA
jgi:hypothetical protein